MPVLRSGKRTWVEIEDFNTDRGIVEWEGDYFKTMALEYVSSRNGRSGKVSAAQSYLFDATNLAKFTIQ